jgi:hypothetical protein
MAEHQDDLKSTIAVGRLRNEQSRVNPSIDPSEFLERVLK